MRPVTAPRKAGPPRAPQGPAYKGRYLRVAPFLLGDFGMWGLLIFFLVTAYFAVNGILWAIMFTPFAEKALDFKDSEPREPLAFKIAMAFFALPYSIGWGLKEALRDYAARRCRRRYSPGSS